jgi:hypothetical protein
VYFVGVGSALVESTVWMNVSPLRTTVCALAVNENMKAIVIANTNASNGFLLKYIILFLN